MKDRIVITGAHENNLKYVNLEIPKGKLVVFNDPHGMCPECSGLSKTVAFA